jgi:TBC1 domain family protein 5
VLEADYSVALTMVLKYPSLGLQHGPSTIVGDALYLRGNFNEDGGSKIITQYSGRSPTPFLSSPRFESLSPGRKVNRKRSPLPSPARFLQQQGGVEALLQGAAKGVFERGEKLGINQAVRDAVGEMKKNMQGLAAPNATASRGTSDGNRWSLDEGRSVPFLRNTISSMELRNKQLALMLEEALGDLRRVVTSSTAESPAISDAIGLAIAKAQFVQVYLEDSTLPLPQPSPEIMEPKVPGAFPMTSAVETPPKSKKDDLGLATNAKNTIKGKKMVRSSGNKSPIASSLPEPSKINPVPSTELAVPAGSLRADAEPNVPDRPRAPMPTRSSLAQSSFAWMLEPDDTSVSVTKPTLPKSTSPFLSSSSRRPLSGSTREKAAFLFGDDSNDVDPNPRNDLTVVQNDPDEGFNLGNMRGPQT